MATANLTLAPAPDGDPSKKRKSTLVELEVDLSRPEPPSKKAKRALKKGKTLPKKPHSSDDEADVETDGKEGSGSGSKKTAVKERSPHGVWIGNLRFTVTKAELRQWLVAQSGGAISDEAITRVHLPTTRPTGPGVKREGEAKPANRGFAYVDFDSLEARVAATALSETELGGRRLLIKESNNFQGRPEKAKESGTVDGEERATAAEAGDREASKKSAHAGSTKIFVGNLPFNTTEDALWEQFSKCGTVRWIKVATFEDTGKCKGYAWVNFEEADAAQWAVKGFVKIKETIDTVEDFMEEDEKDDGVTKPASQRGDVKGNKRDTSDNARRTKTRKWWVNQLLGRTLKIELAEDDQVRYKKRFGRDAKREQKHPARERQQHPRAKHKDTPAERQQQESTTVAEAKTAVGKEPHKSRPLNVATDISVARLTGAPVAAQGKKITFD